MEFYVIAAPRTGIRTAVFAAVLMGVPWLSHAKEEPTTVGEEVGKMSSVRKLVPAESLERMAVTQYAQLQRDAAAKNKLVSKDDPRVTRLRQIASKIIPYAHPWNERSPQWKWEVNLIDSDQINAFCMPGGKIAFYTGILDKLKLTDDEVAMVMGHEIAHALREHSRERAAKGQLTELGAGVISSVFGLGDLGRVAVGGGATLLNLTFSRSDETEADIVGLDIAARAGFDPRAGISLWQKMTAASKGAPPQFLSTHPAGKNRIKEIEKHLPKVLPLYEQARTRKG